MLEDAMVIKFKKNGKQFEIYANKDKAYPYHCGEPVKLGDVLESDEVYKDAKKGERWDEKTLMDCFGTENQIEIAGYILKHADVPMSAEQRKQKTEAIRKQIIEIIRRETIDPRTNAPHTIIRIENAWEQARVTVDISKSAEQQVEQVIKLMRPIIPIKSETVELEVRVPAAQAGRAYGMIKEFSPKKEEWTSSGDLVAVLSIPAGIQGEVYAKINNSTQGMAQTKIISKTDK